MQSYSTSTRVRYQETDQMGMAYHANYLVWMEIGRTEFFREIGIPYKKFEDSGIMLPVIEAKCTYKRSAVYDEVITIETSMVELSPVKIRAEYRLIKEDGDTAAEGYTMHAFVNLKGKAVNAKKNIPQIFSLLESYIGS
ncbi:MAG: acyl-CoA thioesterase [bacterium]